MRRGNIILSFVIGLLLASGIALLVGAKTTAVLLLFLSGTAGLLAQISLRLACREAVRQLQELKRLPQGERLILNHPDLLELTEAVNLMVQETEEATAKAALQVKELEIQLKVVTAERQHAEAILYSISDAVLVTDPFDELVLANESAARAFSFELSKTTRAPVERVLNDPRMLDLIRDMRQSRSRHGRRIVEHNIRTPDGERVFKVTLSCVADGTTNSSLQSNSPDDPSAIEGIGSGVVTVLHDMTREKEVAEMKNDFVSSVSHELRTPLASIKAYVEMLIDGEADDGKTQREFYDIIQNEANRLGRLIDNILNISRIESGLTKVNKQPQSLAVVLKDALEVILPQARTKKIRLIEELTPVFYQTLADRDMLYQAVLNLLSNAVKYTPEGGSITVQTEVDEAKRRIITRISDTGVGIPAKDLPFVFDKFYRAEANNHMAKGTGLGLSLVKHIIETVHHGRLFLESQVGKGSTFGFEMAMSD